MTDKETDIATGFGPLLKFWRGVHGFSQETLALCAESSTRHISCLENGKAHPSRLMVLKLSEVLELGDRDSCYLLLGAGYLPTANSVDFNSQEYKWLRKAMILTLKAMDPFPAALMDRYGRLLMVNKGWVSFHNKTISHDELAGATNHYELLFKRQRSDDTSEIKKNTISLILMAMQQEALLSGDGHQEMMDALMSQNHIPKDWKKRAANLEPQASFRVQVDVEGKAQNFFSVSQMVGALGPTSFISEPRLIINTLYPEDTDLDLASNLDCDLQHPLLPY
jgi:transcriptional regulator with XRE-family HTH domain